MLSNDRTRTFTHEFMGQWLGTHHLAVGEGPDQLKLRKEYPHELMYSMMTEPGEYLLDMLNNNAPLTDLIASDYVVVNKRLAEHYELPPPAGVNDKDFFRLPVEDGKRGGVVTMAGVLAITSRPARTSPVLRGKWILDELLSYPPPPPPPTVPSLEGSANKTAGSGSLRARLEHHRNDPNCISCHQRIDPLGFGLENYDLLGRWRDKDSSGLTLDTAGIMPSGESFSGPTELKNVLMSRQDRIINTVVERMLSYALGRNLERYDRSTVRLITTDLAKTEWPTQKLIEEIVLSLPFRFKRNPTVAVNIPSPDSTP
jgi:hypothetical protein